MNQLLIASILFLVIAVFRSVRPSVWNKIPVSVRWLVPLALAVVQEVAVAIKTGQPWQVAAAQGVFAGLMAMGMHTGIKAIPGPYKG